jgi:hypothetical protein
MPKKKEEVYVEDKNPFACLASDSDSDSDSSLAPAIVSVTRPTIGSVSPAQFRVWADEAVPGASNVFSTPFSRAAVQKRWNHPRFQEDSEGWTSISWTQPQFIDDAASEKKSVTSEEDIPVPVIPPQEFPSLLLRGTIDDVKETPAAVWAERVKKQLDKAEAARATRREGRLSFFRSSATQESV